MKQQNYVPCETAIALRKAGYEDVIVAAEQSAVLDWLQDKGIVITTEYDDKEKLFFCYLYHNDMDDQPMVSGTDSYADRHVAINAAINKAIAILS